MTRIDLQLLSARGLLLVKGLQAHQALVLGREHAPAMCMQAQRDQKAELNNKPHGTLASL